MHSVPFVPSVAAHRIALLLALVSPDIRWSDCTASTACTLLLIIRGGTIPIFFRVLKDVVIFPDLEGPFPPSPFLS